MDIAEILKTASYVLSIVAILVPVAQKIAAMTAGDSDDKFVARVAAALHDLLAAVPALRLGEDVEKVRARKRAKRGMPK